MDKLEAERYKDFREKLIVNERDFVIAYRDEHDLPDRAILLATFATQIEGLGLAIARGLVPADGVIEALADAVLAHTASARSDAIAEELEEIVRAELAKDEIPRPSLPDEGTE